MNIRTQILQLEKHSKLLEPQKDLRKNWEQQLQEHGHDFLDQLPQLKAYDGPPPSDLQLLDIPKQGRPIEDILPWYQQKVERTGINPASARHFGYVPGGGVYTTALGDYLAALSNRYAGILFANPGAVQIENQLIRWMCQMIDYPTDALGNLCSGGSIANLIAITTARDYKNITSAKVPRAVVYLTSQVHHCVQKALAIAGLREAVIRYIPVDEELRMQPAILRKQIQQDQANGLHPFLVAASAGTTNTGVIDPLNDIADIAEEFDLWYHVDAAYGGFFMLLEQYKPLFKGVERSDSFTIDPHKGLFLAYGLGAVLIKNVQAQMNAFTYSADYLQDAVEIAAEPSPADLSPELTKHFRGLRMWLSLQLLGTDCFKAALEEKILLCQYFHDQVQELGFRTGPVPDLSITIYRYEVDFMDSNIFNQRLMEHIVQDGRIFLSSTTIEGVFWIRMAVLSFRTHLAEVDECLTILQKALQELLQKYHNELSIKSKQ